MILRLWMQTVKLNYKVLAVLTYHIKENTPAEDSYALSGGVYLMGKCSLK